MLSEPQVKLEDRKLFVGGLHEDTNNDELKCYFCRFGAVEDAIVMIDSTTNRSRGFGFVTFKEPESVQNVFSMPDHLIHRKKVDPKPAYEKGHEAKVQEMLHQNKVFVGGLPQSVTQSSLTQYFSKYGNVTGVELKKDKATGRMRGFGFVEFESIDAACGASHIQFQQFLDKTIEVKPAEARDKKPKHHTLQNYPTLTAGYGHSEWGPPQPEFAGYSQPNSSYSTTYQQQPYFSNYGPGSTGYTAHQAYNYSTHHQSHPHHQQEYNGYPAHSGYRQQEFGAYATGGYANHQQMAANYHPSMAHNSQEPNAFGQHRAANYGSSAESYPTAYPGQHQYSGYSTAYDTSLSYSNPSNPNPGYGGRGSNNRGGHFGYGR